MQIKKRSNKRGMLALSQILILIVGIIAISYAIGGGLREVGAGEPGPIKDTCTYQGQYTCMSLNECDSKGGTPHEKLCGDFKYNSKYKKDKNGVWQVSNDVGAISGGNIQCCVIKDEEKPDYFSNLGKFSGLAPLPTSKISGLSLLEKKEPEAPPSPEPPLDDLKDKQGFFKKIISSNTFWAVIITAAIYSWFKFKEKDTWRANKVIEAAGIGYFIGSTAEKLLPKLGLEGGWLRFGVWTAGIGAAVTYLLIFGENEKYETVQFTCYPWEAPTGGDKCEECNKQGILPCSPYQCRSLGQACELVNPGTDEEMCVWVNRKDVKYPIIQPWTDALSSGYNYVPDDTISPPDRGVEIKPAGKDCVAPFTPLSFGVTLNEPAKCKIDYVRKSSFDEMSYYFGGSQLLKYNHTQTMSLPGAEALAAENITLENDNEYDLSVRCQDANGNANIANFVFRFCVDEGPDTTPPLIVTTDLLNNMPIAYNQSSVDIQVYVNEPLAIREGGCKWSHLDQTYDNMEESMTCVTSVMEFNAQMLYKCTTTLTGIKNRVENKFYFRCMDKAGNKNEESYKFSLIGTQPLVIDWIKPNETVKDSTDFVKVELEARTSAGYKEGEATCYFSETGEENDYVEFYNTNSYQHSQDIYREEGEYTYYIKCVDLGGNQDLEQTTFWVESDSESPVVVRAYHEETYLKLITDESATCVYDTVSCNYVFEDGISMTTVDDTHHYTDWNTESTLYVKCQDDYGNQPMPNECSIIVRGVEN